jgi:hypothetical protein
MDEKNEFLTILSVDFPDSPTFPRKPAELGPEKRTRDDSRYRIVRTSVDAPSRLLRSISTWKSEALVQY